MFVPAEVGVALAWLLGHVAAGPASTQASASVELQWTAPANCPPAEAVQGEMQGRLDADASLDPTTTVAVVVRVEEDGEGFAAQLEVQAPSGQTTRTLRAARCEVVVEASALIVAMAAGVESPLEPAPQNATESVEPAPSPAGPKAAQEPPHNASPPQRTLDEPIAPRRTPDRMKLGGQAHVQAGLGLGAIATPSGAVGLGGGLTLGRWQVDLAGRVWFSQRLPIPGREELGAEVLLWTLGFRAGPVLNWGRFEFPLQAGVDGGLARGRGYGITTRRVSTRPWVSVGLFPGVLWHLNERFGFGLATELSGVILRPVFRISDVDASIAPARVRGGIHGRIQVRFP